MKKNSLNAWLKQWDEAGFDFTAALEAKKTKQPEKPVDGSYDWKRQPVRRLQSSEIKAFQQVYPILAAVLCAVIIAFLLLTVAELPAFGSPDAPAHNEVMERYVEQGMAETGAVNTVAGVILDYRAFDTLGESHVLYTATTAVLILLLTVNGEPEPEAQRRIMQRDLILCVTAKILVPVAMLFGIYVIFNGHLGPGGGFSGGAILGASLILYSIAFGFERLERFLNLKTFRIIVLCALCFYSVAKCYSFFCGANALESIITQGTPGNIFSAGLILPLNIAVGVVVACTMYGFYSVFQRGRI